jgi:histone H3/H4
MYFPSYGSGRDKEQEGTNPMAGRRTKQTLRRIVRQPLLREWSFRQLVRAAARSDRVRRATGRTVRFDAAATEALRVMAESYLVHLYDDIHRCVSHGRRLTVLPRDIRLAREMRGEPVPSAAVE